MKRVLFAAVLGATLAWASPARAATTTILSTTTYGGVSTQAIANVLAAGLPGVGAYYFNLVVTSTNSTPFSSLSVYMQQQGISGGVQYYTIYNGTFTTTSAPGSSFLVPDMYIGGSVRPQWTISSGSATFTVTAISASP